MTNDSQIHAIADALGLSPFVALAVVLGLALAASAMAARYMADADAGLPPNARRKMTAARRNATRNNRAAQDRPPVWRRQVATEGRVYVRTLRAQLIAENGGR